MSTVYNKDFMYKQTANNMLLPTYQPPELKNIIYNVIMENNEKNKRYQ